MRAALKLSLRAASCCSVEVTNGGFGRSTTARDSTEGLTLTADRVDYDRRAQVTRASAHPKLVQDPREGKGAVLVSGDTIVVDSPRRVATAIGNVVVERDSLHAITRNQTAVRKARATGQVTRVHLP